MGTGMTVAPYYMPDEVWRSLLGNSWEREGCRKRKRLDVTLWSHTTTCPGSLEPWLCAVGATWHPPHHQLSQHGFCTPASFPQVPVAKAGAGLHRLSALLTPSWWLPGSQPALLQGRPRVVIHGNCSLCRSIQFRPSELP